MSSNIFTKNVRVGTGENITLTGVSRNQDDGLVEYLRHKLQTVPGLTLRGIAERSGGEITHSYLSKLLSAAATNPSQDKLKAIAKGLGVPKNEVFTAASGKPLTPMAPTDFKSALTAMGVDGFDVYGGVESLTEEDRQEIVAMLATMIEQKLIHRQKVAASVKGASKMARVASPLHPPGWETQAGPARGREKPVYSARKRDKKSRQA